MYKLQRYIKDGVNSGDEYANKRVCTISYGRHMPVRGTWEAQKMQG